MYTKQGREEGLEKGKQKRRERERVSTLLGSKPRSGRQVCSIQPRIPAIVTRRFLRCPLAQDANNDVTMAAVSALQKQRPLCASADRVLSLSHSLSLFARVMWLHERARPQRFAARCFRRLTVILVNGVFKNNIHVPRRPTTPDGTRVKGLARSWITYSRHPWWNDFSFVRGLWFFFPLFLFFFLDAFDLWNIWNISGIENLYSIQRTGFEIKMRREREW